MALKIRLARGGAKKRPFYRIVVADSRAPRDGRFIAKIGIYDPRLPKDSPDRVKLDGQLAAEWIRKGAKPTDRVARFLSEITLEGESQPVWAWETGNNPKKGEPGAKARERAEEKKQQDEAKAAAIPEEKTSEGDTASSEDNAETSPEATEDETAEAKND